VDNSLVTCVFFLIYGITTEVEGMPVGNASTRTHSRMRSYAQTDGQPENIIPPTTVIYIR